MKAGIADVCEIINGFAFKSENYTTSGIRIIRIANVQKGYVEDNTPQYYPLSEVDKIQQYILNEGDILLSLTGNVGRVAVLEKQFLPAALNQRVACLRPNIDILTPRYLFYALLSSKFEKDCIEASRGIAQKNMSTEWLKQYPINLRDINEQIKITNRLDLLTRIITRRRTQLAKLDELVKCRFVEMFGDLSVYEEKPLNDVCSFIDYRGKTPVKAEAGVPLITAKNVGIGVYSYEPREYIDSAIYDSWMTRGFPRVGDILFTTEAPLGHVCRIPEMSGRFSVGQRLIVIQPDALLLDYDFVSFILQSPDFQEKVLQKSTGSTVRGIRSKELIKLTIPIPPLTQQQTFADFVHRVDKLRFFVGRV